MAGEILKIDNLCKSYIDCGQKIDVLQNINITLNPGENLSIIGRSGSGKTTLLQIIGLLDTYNSGEFYLFGHDVRSISAEKKNNILKNDISFVHQFFHLFPEFNAIENVSIPLINKGVSKKNSILIASEILDELGMQNKKNNQIWQLSGGERQRVGIARAIVNKPKIILADEPTGSLDPKNSEIVMNLLLDICLKYSSSLILISHHDFKIPGNIVNLN